MNKFTSKIDYFIDQYTVEKQLYKLGPKWLKRGWLEKEDFLTICLWKSRRPKKLYIANAALEIKNCTRAAFSEKDELLKLNHLTKLSGVSVPTASAILSVTNPQDYPIIDERCIQSLNKLGCITWETITPNRWLDYISIVRTIAKAYGKTAREVEMGLFAYNRIMLDREYKNLY
ncbi:MAG: hypothetical protein JJ975_01550 [Bacteroidia bacterium]|nr:hypothetical protein [Bacteroidia bacterium]